MTGQPRRTTDGPHAQQPRQESEQEAPSPVRHGSAAVVPAPPPLPYAVVDPSAPYGRTATGRPYSDRSKVIAGLLQIFLPGLGVGRFYTGHHMRGGAQLALTVIGYLAQVLGFLVMVPLSLAVDAFGSESLPEASLFASLAALGVSLLILAGAASWTLIDGILMLCDRVKDAQGRPLRP